MRCLLALLLISLNGFPQSAANDDSPQDKPADFVVRINVNLVQVDAAVTDSKGHKVTGLKADDFEVLQDGVPQKITNFSYVENGVKAPSASPPWAPPVPLKPEQVRRTIVLVVDDLGMSFEGMAYVRGALKKFVDHTMQPGDLVAIIRTGAGIGALQQFTTDKRLLYAAIDHVKISFLGRAASFVPMDIARTLESPSVGPQGTGSTTDHNQPFRELAAGDACINETSSALGSLAAVRYVVDGLRELPGRKALIFFSEQMKMQERPDRVGTSEECTYEQVRQSFHGLTDAAERSAVVFYTVDPRGVTTLVADATSNPFSGGPVKSSQVAEDTVNGSQREMRSEYYSSQQGLQYLARETGGTFADHNDIAGAIRDAVEDSSSYYVIGYHPPANTFDAKDSPKRFHRIQVNVKGHGLKVRSRSGFLGFSGKEESNRKLSPGQQFARVLASPFAENDIRLRMTTFFSSWERPLLTTLLYLDAKDLSFTKRPDGTYKSVLDAVAMTFDANGAAVSSTQRIYSFTTTEKDYQLVVKYGVLLRLQHAVQNPGAYQMRVAVRDAGSGKMGSANQFVEVPNLKRRRLALSGILLKQLEPEETPAGLGKDSSPALDAKGNEAIRIFKPGEKVGWFYQIFNAKSGADQHASLNVQVRLFRDGLQVIESEPAVARLPQNSAAGYLSASGHMLIGPKLTPGDYALQLVVTDNLARKKHASASQWIDFAVETPLDALGSERQ